MGGLLKEDIAIRPSQPTSSGWQSEDKSEIVATVRGGPAAVQAGDRTVFGYQDGNVGTSLGAAAAMATATATGKMAEVDNSVYQIRSFPPYRRLALASQEWRRKKDDTRSGFEARAGACWLAWCLGRRAKAPKKDDDTCVVSHRAAPAQASPRICALVRRTRSVALLVSLLEWLYEGARISRGELTVRC